MFSFHFAPTVSDAFLTSVHIHPPSVSAHRVKITHLLKAQARHGTGHGLIANGMDELQSLLALWAAGQRGLVYLLSNTGVVQIALSCGSQALQFVM